MLKMKKAFTLVEALTSLLLVGIVMVAMGNTLSSTIKVSGSKDIGVQILTQNINTVEMLRDNVKSKDDLWRLSEVYNSKIDKYHTTTKCKVVAVGEGTIDSLKDIEVASGTTATKVENARVRNDNFGYAYKFSGVGDKFMIESTQLEDKYSYVWICLAAPEDVISVVEIKQGGLTQTVTFSGTYYEKVTTMDKNITITNKQACASGNEIYVANMIFVKDGTALGPDGLPVGVDEVNTIPETLQNKEGYFPTLYKVDISTEVDRSGLTEIDNEVLNKASEINKKITTYIMLKE